MKRPGPTPVARAGLTWLALSLLFFVPASGLAQQPQEQEEHTSDAFGWTDRDQQVLSEWGTLPDEIARVMNAKSDGYHERALGFSCRETIRFSEYRDGYAGKERLRAYDYLLVTDESAPGGHVALRTRPGSGETEGLKTDLPFPEPFLFHRIFQDSLRSTLRFKAGHWRTTPWRLALPVSWISSAPVFEQNRISEWSGTVEVEYRTGNIIRVVAHPNFQEERLDKELEQYLTAFRFMGFSTAPPPLGLELTIDFGYEHEGFLYPTRVEVHTFRQIHRGVQATVSRLIAEYKDYRFFGTYTEAEIPPFLYQPPAPPPSPTKPTEDELFDDPFEDL